MKIEYLIKTNDASIYHAIISSIWGFFLIGLSIFLYDRSHITSLLLVFFSLRAILYQGIDLWFPKKIFLKNGVVYIRCWGINFIVDKELSYINIDNMFDLSPSNTKHPTLNVYRNNPNYLKRILKNKIKLNKITQSNIEEIKAQAQEISKLFGLRFIDDYEYWWIG